MQGETVRKDRNPHQAHAAPQAQIPAMKPDTRSFYVDAVQRVIAQLVANLDDSADLAALASLANLSPFHFHRVFRGMVGETPLELLRRLRLERAAHLLHHTAQPVTTIAFTAGYETHEAFTRAFRTAFGEPPSGFRQNERARAILAAPCGIHFDANGISASFIPRDTGGATMQITLQPLPALRLATVEHVGPFNQIGAAFEKLSAIAGRAGLFAHPGAMMIATYDDDPEGKPAEELRSRACISIPDGIPLPAGLEEQRIPAATYACYTHIGGYDVLGDVWSRFMGEALPASGHMLADGPALEIYRSDMRTTPMAEWRTDLMAPVVTV
jgi:AraC family transcriptional regulator